MHLLTIKKREIELMRIVDSLKNWMAPDAEEDDELEAETDPVQAVAPVKKVERCKTDHRVVNIQTTTRLRVTLMRAKTWEDAAAIADQLKNMWTIVVNLEETDAEVARRVLDYLSGVTYATDGRITRIAAKTYILSPYQVEIEENLLTELGNSGICS